MTMQHAVRAVTSRAWAALLVAGVVVAGAVVLSGGSPVSDDPLAGLRATHLAQFTDADVDLYVREYRNLEPDVNRRLVHYVQRSLGQRFELGAPMYAMDRCDCVTFVERVYAMALASDYDSFRRIVARLRFKNATAAAGVEGYLNRNHFTIGEWVPNNAWLFEDITKQLGHEEIKPWIPLHHIIRRKTFFAEQGITVDVPDEKVVDAFVPLEAVAGIFDQLQDGDLVLNIRGELGNQYCDHWGVITIDEEPADAALAQRVKFAQASSPWSCAVPLMDWLAARKEVQGFKFLRLRPDAEARVQQELSR